MSGEPVIIEVALNGATAPERNRTVRGRPTRSSSRATPASTRTSIVHNHLVSHGLPLDRDRRGLHAVLRLVAHARPRTCCRCQRSRRGAGLEGKLGRLDLLARRRGLF